MSENISVLADKWYHDYAPAPYIGFYKLMTPGILIRNVDLVKDILIKDHQSFHANDIAFSEKHDKLLAHNPFAINDEKWKRSRSIMNQFFTTSKIKSIFPLMEQPSMEMVQYLKEKGDMKDIEAKSLGLKFTTQNVARCCFSIDAQCFGHTESEFRKIGKLIFQPGFWTGMKFMVLSFCPYLVDVLPIGFIPQEVTDWFINLIKNNKASRLTAKLENEDMLQLLLNMSDKYEMTEDELAGHALSLLVEGFETSSSVISFVLYDLANNIEVQEKLYDEISTVIERNNNKITFDAVQEMKYLDCVVSESMRLNVVGMIIKRVCTKPYQLPVINGQKQPFTVQPGTPDPQYFPQPDIFDPSRFTDELKNEIPKGVYLPFGEGPRICPGMRFAMAQIKAGVVHVVKNYKISISKNHKPFVLENRALLYQPRDGLLLNFKLRE